MLKDKIIFLLHYITIIFFLQDTESIDIIEIIYLIFWLLFLVNGFFIYLRGSGKRLITTKLELSVIIFLVYLFTTIVISIGNDANLLKWIREYIVFLIFADVIFIKFYINSNDNSIKYYINVISSSFLIIAIWNIYLFVSKIGTLEFVWEILQSRASDSEPLLVFGLVLSFIGLLTSKKASYKVLFAIKSGIFLTALIVSFSRGYWIAAILCFMIIFIFSGKKEKKSILKYTLYSISIVITLAFTLFGEIILGLFIVLSERFSNIASSAFNDVSVLNRLVESNAMLDRIFESPIFGYGLSSNYRFHDIIIHSQSVTSYGHNGYLILLFKLGIIGTLLYFIVILNAVKIFYSNINIFNDNKIIVVGYQSLLLSSLLVSFSSPQFIQKDGTIVLMVLLSISNLINIARHSKEKYEIAK